MKTPKQQFAESFIKFAESMGITFVDTPIGKVGVGKDEKLDMKQFKGGKNVRK